MFATTKMKIQVLAENRLCDLSDKKNLKTEHGFSCLIQSADGNKILFDTGREVFISNAKELDIDLENISTLILSHAHYDHTDGLSDFFSLSPDSNLIASEKIFLPHYSLKTGKSRFIGLSDDSKNTIKKLNENQKHFFSKEYLLPHQAKIKVHGEIELCHPLEKASSLLFKNVNSTEPDTMEDEIILSIETTKGLFLITGCCHSGFINVCETIKKRTGEKIYGVLGGFHLEGVPKERLEATRDYIKKTKIKKIYPCHCTGDKEIQWLENELPNIAKKAYVGFSLDLEI